VALVRLPEPFDFEVSTERFRAFGPDLANLWHEGGLHRVAGGGELRIEPAEGGVDVEPLDPETGPVARKLLGAEFDLDGFYAWVEAGSDSVLKRLVVALRGFRPPLGPDPFETVVTSITAQQVSLFAAFAIRNRLIERFGVRAVHAYAFPGEAALAAASADEIVATGFSWRKAEYALGIARAGLDWERITALPDEEIHAELQAIRGIGEWTVDWFLARHLARPRAWPAGDLGLRKAVEAFYADGATLTTPEVRAMGTRFEPFQNLTAHYLLTGLRVAGA
jgi:3-methyladenine DNA glycosylase/8-oxoguanine DNA glycosylase